MKCSYTLCSHRDHHHHDRILMNNSSQLSLIIIVTIQQSMIIPHVTILFMVDFNILGRSDRKEEYLRNISLDCFLIMSINLENILN
jgi:hypothetical protein